MISQVREVQTACIMNFKWHIRRTVQGEFKSLYLACGIQESFVKAVNNKKAFQSNANRQLAGSPGYVVNKFQHVREGKGGSCMVRSKLNKFELL